MSGDADGFEPKGADGVVDVSSPAKPKKPPLDELWREIKRRAATKDEGALTGEARKQAREKVVALYGEPTPELRVFLAAHYPGKTDAEIQEHLFELLRGEQWAEYGIDRRYDLAALKGLKEEELARLHLKEADKESILEAAMAVALLVTKDDLEPLADGRYRLVTRKFGAVYRLAKNERFWEQPIVGFCSAVLVRPDVVATAGHCVRSEVVLQRTRFVFGFRLAADGRAVEEVSASQVYEAEGFVRGAGVENPVEDPDTLSDWALIKLKRPVDLPGVKPVSLQERASPEKIPDTGPFHLYVIGHPCGLPCKFAGGARVTDNTEATFFKANLDTFGGNSGSPVFNCEHLLEGILARGQPDFAKVPVTGEGATPGDWQARTLVYPAIAAGEVDEAGESCTRLSELLPLLR